MIHNIFWLPQCGFHLEGEDADAYLRQIWDREFQRQGVAYNGPAVINHLDPSVVSLLPASREEVIALDENPDTPPDLARLCRAYLARETQACAHSFVYDDLGYDYCTRCGLYR